MNATTGKSDKRNAAPLALEGIKVVEWCDHRGEFCGRMLSSMGAEVVKIEPPQGHASRGIGPFNDEFGGADSSIYWWSYNIGKKSVVLDVAQTDGLARLRQLIGAADILIESGGPGGLERAGLAWEDLHREFPRLIVLSVSDFGIDGPWSGYTGGDLIALATGGIMMVSGYPPGADGRYDTPPIAPQMHQSAHLIGCLGSMDVLAALAWRDRSGRGQRIDLSLHAVVNNCTENNLAWYMIGKRVVPRKPQMPEMRARDGTFVQVLLGLFPGEWERVVELLDEAGMAEDLKDPRYSDPAWRGLPEQNRHVDDVVRRFIATQDAEALFHAAQKKGVVWGPIREPQQSIDDPHFSTRDNFVAVRHEELDRDVVYPGAPWVSEQLGWRTGPRAPRVGEHTDAVFSTWVDKASA